MRFGSRLRKERGGARQINDVVGLELGAELARGVPAVRLQRKDEGVHLIAAGFLDLPGAIPESPDAAEREEGGWQLPSPYRALHAALALQSEKAFLRHSVAATSARTGDDDAMRMRQTERVVVSGLPPLTAGLPEFQAAWAARLFPESRRPTTCSIQIAPTAALAGCMRSPLFADGNRNAIVVTVFATHSTLSVFQDGGLVLHRKQPIGYRMIRDDISSRMRVDAEMVDAILDDNLVDLEPMLEPILRPLLRQIEISMDFLARRGGSAEKSFFICGLPAGFRYWAMLFKRILNQELRVCGFDEVVASLNAGSPRTKNQELGEGNSSALLLCAAGAALAVLDEFT